jgi:hypothetical protein
MRKTELLGPGRVGVDYDLPAVLGSATYKGLADVLSARGTVDTWDAASLCEKFLGRHVVLHVTMPTRLSPARCGDRR